jgi:branched-chain amino acid transport system permease protein
MLLPALVPEDEGIAILAERRLPEAGLGVDFRLGAEGAARRIACRFGGIGYSAAKRDLVAVELDATPLGEATLWFLKARWLESAESIRADPGPPRAGAAPIALPQPAALALQHLIGGLPRLVILALLALATALIYGLIGRINLAFGEFAAMGGIAASLVVALLATTGADATGLAPLAALLAVLALTAAHGAAMGRAILWPLARHQGQPLIVAGLGVLVAVQEGLRLAQGSGTRWLPPGLGEIRRIATTPGFEVVVQPALLATGLAAALGIAGLLAAMRRSAFGRTWRASADDPLAAALCGIDPRRLLIRTSALATALAGLAGALVTLNYGGMNHAGGTALGLTALIAAILGGVGSLGGAVAGAVAIGLFQIGWSALLPIAQGELATFALLTIAMVLKPGGFFGHADGAQRKV